VAEPVETLSRTFLECLYHIYQEFIIQSLTEDEAQTEKKSKATKKKKAKKRV
jgi:hypothetical protein